MIDAGGKWVLPGMVDIHTHYDVEVLSALRCRSRCATGDDGDGGFVFAVDRSRRRPRTPVTCSRVEAIPREHVINTVEEHKTWSNCEEYIAALEDRPLGPNVAAFIGHSDMRTATMGLDRATRKTCVRPRPSRPGWSSCWLRP